jgi:ribosome biogenesis GTPase
MGDRPVSPDADAGAAVETLTVARVDFGTCLLIDEQGGFHDAHARGKLMGARKSLGNAVVVGDRVRVARDGGRVVVEDVEPRRNTFSRRATGEKPLEQVIAANLDQIVVVASVAEPEFRPGFVDRVLSQAEHSGIPARLVLNKSDLGRHDETLAIIEDYRVAGYPGHEICAKRGEGVDTLHHACLARRSLFVGHSGVGKSTLLEVLVPDAVLKSGTVNPKTGKGRHTTTAAILLRPEPGFELIDTPGVRGFGLWGIGSRDLEQSYVEFRPHLGSCRFGDCRHSNEPGCALRAAVDAGSVPRRRFESFRKLREELEQEERHMGTRESRGRL